MRTERNKDGTWNVWMTCDEYREIPRQAHSGLAEVAIRLMGDCGLRVAEVLDVRPCDVSRRSDGRNYELEVVSGKDTSGEYDGGKHRETWLPRDLEAHMNRLIQGDTLGVADDEPIVDRTKRTVQNWVEDAAARAAEETGDDDDWALAVECKPTRTASFVEDLAGLFEAEAGHTQVERIGRRIYLTPLAMDRLTDAE